MSDAGSRPFALEVGQAVRPIVGEVASGDASATIPWRTGLIVALVDGLGHGRRAAEAAQSFLESVRRHANEPLGELFALAHRDLLRTRGAVAAVARVDLERAELEIGGLGNITAALVRANREPVTHALMMPGVLGSAYRAVRAQKLVLSVGDMLFLHSDGVRSRFPLDPLRAMSAAAASAHVVETAGKASDDAACAVAWLRQGGVDAPRVDPSSEDEPAHTVPIRSPGDDVFAGAETRAFGARVGLSPRGQWEMSLVASELATNVIKFAGSGTMTLRCVRTPQKALVLEMLDAGEGIRDLDSSLIDGFSEGALLSPDRPRRAGQGLGVGLGTVRRMSDHVAIDTGPGRGTRVVVQKYLR